MLMHVRARAGEVVMATDGKNASKGGLILRAYVLAVRDGLMGRVRQNETPQFRK